MNLSELYQDVIIDHNNNPRNFHALPDSDRQAKGYNPVCGDQVTLYLKIKDNTITSASFQGCGCAISTASASMLTETLIGKTTDEAKLMFDQFKKAVTTDEECSIPLGKLCALTGVKSFPSRVKCATLAWHTLLSALNQEATVSTE